jgi:hypothetical protein
MPIIQYLQDHILSLEYQSSNHTYLQRYLDPFFLGPNYNSFTICDKEIGCEDDYDHIMMLNEKPISHFPNTTILEPNRKIQFQDHSFPQMFHSCACNGEVDYANKTIDFDLINPNYDTFLFVDITNEWSKQVDEDPLDYIDACGQYCFECPHEVNQILNGIMIFQIHCFNWKNSRSSTLICIPLLICADFPLMMMMISRVFLCL